jgi:uncharacterized coiled-coil DUF342 family protein
MTLENLKKQRDELNDKAHELVVGSKESTQRVKKLRSELRNAKKKRDEENKSVQELKKKRDEINKKIKAKVDELNKLQGSIDNTKKSIGSGFREAKKELERLEWKVQTDVLNVKQEEKMVRKIAELEETVGSSEEFFEKRKGFRTIIKELDALRKEAQKYHEQMLQHAKASEVYHDSVQDIYKKIKVLEPEQKEISDKIRQAKREADEAHKLFREEFTKVKGVEIAARETSHKEKVNEMRKKANQLMSEFKSGKKLTTEELQIIAGYGDD